MQFKHPEILYALLLLIIPILVHLFQLQRFVKVPFTNVKFLKNIAQQTRKSARIKKLLILTTRMLAFTCLIFAFAQPFFSAQTSQQNLNTTIYIDNSFSMQLKGPQGELLKNISQQIIEKTASQNNTVSLVTNTNYLKDLDAENLKNALINIEYAATKLDLSTVLLQINKLNSNESNTLNKSILISDFQNLNIKNENVFTNVNSPTILLKATTKEQNNIFVDSIYIDGETLEEITLNVQLKSTQNKDLNIPVSLTEGAKLVGKATARFNNTNQNTIQFSIPNTSKFNGKIALTDEVLAFDNDFYFSISRPAKINVLSIGNNSDFLTKIYTENEFNFTPTSLQNLNYNNIQNQQLIILNALDLIPKELINILAEYLKNGGSLVLIPSENTDLVSYNQLFNLFNFGSIKSKIENKHKITSINYDHPLISNVFEKKVTNFEYPSTSVYFNSYLNNSSSILKFDNNEPFISSFNLSNSKVYWIASPLNNETTDFTKSSLVVPIFYNFAKNSLISAALYHTINPNTKIEIPATIGKDEVLKISNENASFIPLQLVSQNKVTIDLQNTELKSGFYSVLNNDNNIQTLAFNYNREESDLNYMNLENLVENAENVTISSSVDEIFEEINSQQKINWLFKWFLAFSALFLLIEMLILKYFKI